MARKTIRSRDYPVNMSIHKLISHDPWRNHLRVVFFACTGNYLQVAMIVFLALLVFLAHNSPMPNKAASGERIGGHCGGSLTVRPLRFRSKEKLTAGAHSRRERVIEAAAPRNKSCQTSGALRWAQQLTGTALIEISKAPASGAAGTRQRGYACKPLATGAKSEPGDSGL